MENSITEIAGLITRSFEENFEKMLTEKKDISEFVIEIKKTLDMPRSIRGAVPKGTMGKF